MGGEGGGRVCEQIVTCAWVASANKSWRSERFHAEQEDPISAGDAAVGACGALCDLVRFWSPLWTQLEFEEGHKFNKVHIDLP